VSAFLGPDMQEVRCIDCDLSLGWQAADVPIDYEYWVHNRCPVRIARDLRISNEEWDEMFFAVSRSIRASYPEFPNNVLDDPGNEVIQALRSDIAAGMALERLTILGYSLVKKEDQ
jgi:hypothetical protein